MERRQWPGKPLPALLVAIGLGLGISRLALAVDLPPAIDLRAEASRAEKAGGPLIILFSRKDCAYCETVRRDYLQAVLANPRHARRVLLRQINQDSEAALIGFSGEQTSHAGFAAGEKIRLVPVVAFYGRNGRQLAKAIVGTRIPDFYPGDLEQAIEKSIEGLQPAAQ